MELNKLEIPLKVKNKKDNKSQSISPINNSPEPVDSKQSMNIGANEDAVDNDNTLCVNENLALNKSILSITDAA